MIKLMQWNKVVRFCAISECWMFKVSQKNVNKSNQCELYNIHSCKKVGQGRRWIWWIWIKHPQSKVLGKQRQFYKMVLQETRWRLHIFSHIYYIQPELTHNYLKLTESWRVAWWYSIVPVLFRISPLASPFAILSFFKRAFACASLIMVTLTWNIKLYASFLHLIITT